MNGFSLFQNRIVGDASALSRVEEIKQKKVLQKIDELYALGDSYYEEGFADDFNFMSFEIDYQDGHKGQLIIDDFRCMIKNFNNDLEENARSGEILVIYEFNDYDAHD